MNEETETQKEANKFLLKCVKHVLDNFQTLLTLKGTVSRDFLLLVLFMNQFPPSPRVVH
jgi:hypothetical protein